MRENGSLSATNVGAHGRSFIHVPTKNGRTRIAKIGPPKRSTVARRGLPTHPSMANVKNHGSKLMRKVPKKQRRATRRHSEVETLVGWDQLNVGVRSSVGKATNGIHPSKRRPPDPQAPRPRSPHAGYHQGLKACPEHELQDHRVAKNPDEQADTA